MLSGVLFELVGVTLIKDLLEIDAAAWAITGAVFGLALAVVNELSDFVSPFLILRLLRLLLPLVLGVLVVFLTALPFRGLTGLFGGMSSAATLLAMVAAAVTLISAAVDESDEDAVADGWMAHATRLLIPSFPRRTVSGSSPRESATASSRAISPPSLATTLARLGSR